MKAKRAASGPDRRSPPASRPGASRARERRGTTASPSVPRPASRAARPGSGRSAPAAAPLRFLTAAALFDGHDAAIQIMRRVLVAEGAEVIHLGHDRSVAELADAAVQEDVQGIAVSSYQGGHVEFFTYLVETLRARGCGHIRVFGGGGGVIAPEEIALLHSRGVARIFTPEDGRALGLEGMIRAMLAECRKAPPAALPAFPETPSPADPVFLGRALSRLESGSGSAGRAGAAAAKLRKDIAARLRKRADAAPDGIITPVIGVTGPGGAGKSSLVDELLLRFLEIFPDKRAAVLCVDPSRRKTGGALLGDRLRVNCASLADRIFFRSSATRRAHASLGACVRGSLDLLRIAGFDLVILETAGTGQSDTEAAEIADATLYVMTPEFGAPSQLEKIGMFDYADCVAVNKCDRPGAEDALREVRKAWQRARNAFGTDAAGIPVFGTCAHRFRDPGVNALANAVFARLAVLVPGAWGHAPLPGGEPDRRGLLPPESSGYLRRIADAVEAYHAATAGQCARAAEAEHRWHGLRFAGLPQPPKAEPAGLAVPAGAAMERAEGKGGEPAGPAQAATGLTGGKADGFARAAHAAGTSAGADADPARAYNAALAALDPGIREGLRGFDALRAAYRAETQDYVVRGAAHTVRNHSESQSGLAIPKVSLPPTESWAAQTEFLREENVPGRFPFAAGVFPFKRENEDATRMFAGEGIAERTNARFHYLSRGQKAVRLSTAFDSVTLYGADPDPRPDIFGKVGNSGVSVCCLDDAKRLYSGFDLCAPDTSVSMTINGPAPILLAYYFNAAVDAACERRLRAEGRWEAAARKAERWFARRDLERPRYRAGSLPPGHDGSGLGFLGLPADLAMDPDEYAEIRDKTLRAVRGTVQADILKEDQAQNTCIFSTEFSLRLMADTQRFFIDRGVRNFYSASISGYHIAEAGANPITQLALTLANGFTYVEYFRARGMDVDAFAPNLSFFFSNGLDPEYAVLGSVARRIWAIAMRDLYGADERSQKLKYHIQTSGRSLHAREIGFNDIRTTLQALLAAGDNCNSLHTNAYDEAVTTPTEASVRRALAIQLILNREFGLLRSENPWQGSWFLADLASKVEAEVLRLFRELDARGGVLGAMETNYQRSRIQEESLRYERRKQNGELPIVGVNTFLAPEAPDAGARPELIRSSEAERQAQVDQAEAIKRRFPREADAALARLRREAVAGGGIFAALLEAAKYCTLGTITRTLFAAGGRYRRNT